MKTKAPTKQGKKQLNLPGRAKKPVAPSYGEKPTKGKVAKKTGGIC